MCVCACVRVCVRERVEQMWREQYFDEATSWMRYAFMRRSYAMLAVHMLAIAKGGPGGTINE